MNVPTISMPRTDARRHYRQYRGRLNKTRENIQIQRGYWAMSQGRTLIDVVDAMRFAGVDDKKQPKLAIARADATKCWYYCGGNGPEFSITEKWDRRRTTGVIRLPEGTLPGLWQTIEAIVPIIPVHLRPFNQDDYFILWEAEWTPTVPKDPMLLKPLHGTLYEIVAAWDLTDLERAVMAQTRLRN